MNRRNDTVSVYTWACEHCLMKKCEAFFSDKNKASFIIKSQFGRLERKEEKETAFG